tara:strand:+ start:24542 stop:25309 length:768 start_codon:yes stop_codon:yes gene_type:complete
MKTVVITGASKGFGFHLSKQFAINDYNVVMNSRNLNSLQHAKKEILKVNNNANIICIPADISKINSSTLIVKKTKVAFGDIDYWINNAGTLVYKHDDFMKFNEDDIYKIINTNLTGTLLGMHSAIDTMSNQIGGGVIYNITGCGSNGEIIPGYSIYAASKFPIEYISNAINKELSNTNVEVKLISPGLLYTDLYKANKNIENTMVHHLCCNPEIVAEYTFKQIEQNQKAKIGYLSGVRFLGVIFKKIASFRVSFF